MGNNLAGSRMRANESPPLVVTFCPSGSEQPDESVGRFPELKGADGEVETTFPCLPEFSLSVSLSELQSEQKVDQSL